jgi:DNA-binding PadR family transcriptional regulator
MGANIRDPEAFLPLTLAEFHILLSLVDGELHGYGIMLEIAERTHDKLRVGPATLYRAIKRLLDASLIAETDQRPDPQLDDERRRYYRLTDFGRQVARAEVERLMELIDYAKAKDLMRDLKITAPRGPTKTRC